jgi:hypothetical protein
MIRVKGWGKAIDEQNIYMYDFVLENEDKNEWNIVHLDI